MALILWNCLAATGFDQRDLGGAQRAILRTVGLSYGAMAAKERDSKFYWLLGAVN